MREIDFGLLCVNDKGEYLVLNDVRMAEIRLASLVYLLIYVSTYCVAIALLRQSKPFPLLYLGHAQIINQTSTTWGRTELNHSVTTQVITSQSVNHFIPSHVASTTTTKNGSDLPQHHKCLHSQNDQWHNLKTVSWHC